MNEYNNNNKKITPHENSTPHSSRNHFHITDLINELKDINEQVDLLTETLDENLDLATRHDGPNTLESHNIDGSKEAKKTEKERQKTLKRRKSIRKKILKSHNKPIINKEEIAAAQINTLDKMDPILNIAERILLNLITDNVSGKVMSIQEAKTNKMIDESTTPLSYPDFSNGKHKPPYYISNFAVMELYRAINDTSLRQVLTTQGKFVETEQMIAASHLEKNVDVRLNPNTQRIELVESCVQSVKAGAEHYALARKNKKQKTSIWTSWIKRS